MFEVWFDNCGREWLVRWDSIDRVLRFRDSAEQCEKLIEEYAEKIVPEIMIFGPPETIERRKGSRAVRVSEVAELLRMFLAALRSLGASGDAGKEQK